MVMTCKDSDHGGDCWCGLDSDWGMRVSVDFDGQIEWWCCIPLAVIECGSELKRIGGGA